MGFRLRVVGSLKTDNSQLRTQNLSLLQGGEVKLIYLIHIAAGTLGLITGYIALYGRKGAGLHRKSGMLFAYAMLTLSVAGTVIAALRNVAPALNIPVALITSYLVVTGVTAVKPPAFGERRLHIAAMLGAFMVSLTIFGFGFKAIANGGKLNGLPPSPFMMFGVIAMLGAIGDLRVLRSGPLLGTSRISRHLWRMSTALLIAALSFFIGQAKVFPKPIRIMPLLAMPVLAVLLTLLYWLWRVRFRRSLRGLVGISERQPSPVERTA